MCRESERLEQPGFEPVDVARWQPDEEFAVYPEGARDKSLVYSPNPVPYPFLVPNHRYLFKHAFNRHPDQFWSEILAYRIGSLLDVAVPPAFVAWDSDNGICGALIEWFLGYPAVPDERYVPGGDIMTSIIPGYERKHGQQHNFLAIERYLTVLADKQRLIGDWLSWWCDTLLFDALIGNTDRHQDNWGLLWRPGPTARMAPAFDNGTSLGYEIFSNKMADFSDPARLERYIARGTHHMRWDIADERPAQHVALIQRLLEHYPKQREDINKRLLGFNVEAMWAMIRGMTEFDIPVPLSPERAEFVCHLTEARYKVLIHSLAE
jgi:hypothetical protein